MKSDEVWSFDGFPWMQSGGPSYHCQRRSQQLMIDHHWLWLHIPTVSPYWMVEACCIFSPRVLLFFLPALSEAENLWSTWHVRSCQSPSCSTWPWKEVSSILRQTHHSCCWQYTFCIYIYTTHTTHTHTHHIQLYIHYSQLYPRYIPFKMVKTKSTHIFLVIFGD